MACSDLFEAAIVDWVRVDSDSFTYACSTWQLISDCVGTCVQRVDTIYFPCVVAELCDSEVSLCISVDDAAPHSFAVP